VSLDETRLAALLSDRYRIEREVGRGGMARVFLAEDLKHARRVAIKVLHPELGAVLGADRFLTEIRTTAQLHHPNILPLFDSGEAGGLVFYVMPYVEGESLRDRLTREGQLGVSDAIRVASEVADALDHAHKHGVIHRDVKPENILLQDGHALVADFGIAIAVRHAAGDRITQTGISLGTPQYMSPEQAAAERQLDGKSDQYSLASVVYEMLAGEPPFTGPSSPAVISRMMTEPPQDLARRRTGVPEPIATAVHRALEKVPGDRYPTVAAFADALRSEGAVATRTTASRASATRGRVRSALWVGGGVAAGAAAMWIVAASRSRATAAPAEYRHWTVTLDDSMPLTIDPGTYGIAARPFDISPNGRAVVYESPAPAGKRLIVVNLLTGASSIVRGAQPAFEPRFSPDGNAVAAALGDSALVRFGLADGSIARIVSKDAGTGTVALPDFLWHPNGRLYVNGGCIVVPASGGKMSVSQSPACNTTWVGAHAAIIPDNPRWMLIDIAGRVGVISTDEHPEFRPLSAPRRGDSSVAIRGSEPRFVAPGYLTYVSGNTIYAAPFDARALRVTAEPKPVLGGVRREQSGAAQFAISNDGTIVWASGADGGLGRFVWVDAGGRVVDTLRFIAPAEVGSFALSADGRRLAYNTLASDGSSTLMVATLASQVIETIPLTGRVDPMRWFDHDSRLAVADYRLDGTIRGGIVSIDRQPAILDTTQSYVDSNDGTLRCYSSFYGDHNPPPARIVRLVAPHDSLVAPASGLDCQFSPDGHYALWRSVAEDGPLVATRTDSLPIARQVRVGPPEGEARWSPDGKSIGWRDAARWMKVSAPGPSLVAPSDPRVMFTGNYLQAYASWTWAPDGRFLLLAGEQPRQRTRLEVITNFGAYVREQVGRSP
jgi:eukaryotic-like serine/threonine-protein kinase